MPNISFKVNPQKALEAIVYIASKLKGVDTYHAVKTMFFADKRHLNEYARPIVGDTYIKMPKGPVPSYVYDIINRNIKTLPIEFYGQVVSSISVSSDKKKYIKANREPNLSEFSESDIECLDYAIAFCKDKKFQDLCDITHQEPAWKNATDNGCMDYELMLDDDNPNREEIIADLKEDSQWLVV